MRKSFHSIIGVLKLYPLWQANALAATLSSLLLVAMAISFVSAAELTRTPRDIRAADISALRGQLLSTQTTATIEPLEKWVNGVETEGCFDTPAGFILIQDSLGRFEYASYGSKSCDSDNVTTLSNMRRGLNPVNPSFQSGTGLDFDAGTEVRLIDYPLLYSQAMFQDLPNTCTASGCVSFSGSGSIAIPTFATLVELKRQLGDPPPTDKVRIACAIDTGECYDGIGGVWRAHSGSNIANASITTAGKVELGVVADIQNHVLLGDSGAPVMIWTNLIALTSTGTTQAFKVIATDSSGYASGSTLGSNPSATTFLRGDQTWATPVRGSGANLVANDIYPTVVGSLGSTTWAAVDATNLNESITVGTGNLLMINFIAKVRRQADTVNKAVFDIQIGNNPISPFGSGATAINFDALSSSAFSFPLNFTLFHKVQTGGTLTIRPVYRLQGVSGGAPSITTDDTTFFQVIRLN